MRSEEREREGASSLQNLGRVVVEERPTFRFDGDRMVMTLGGTSVAVGPGSEPPAPEPPPPPRKAEVVARAPEPPRSVSPPVISVAPPPRPEPTTPRFEPPPPPPPAQAPIPVLSRRAAFPLEREGTRPGTRPGTNPGTGSTSPGLASTPEQIASDVRARPPVAVAVVRRGAQVPDAAFIKALLESECPALLGVPAIGLTQRSWWPSEDALRDGARVLATSVSRDYGADPGAASWHICYGPGHAKVLLILVRRPA